MAKGSIVDYLTQRGKIKPPKHLINSIQYEAIVGSYSYGVSDTLSDTDIIGFSIPPKDIIFPHLAGVIPGFGTNPPNFEQYLQHHIPDPDGMKEGDSARTYDVTIYSIVKFFQLCMENNPNMLDALFVPQRCVTHCTQIGDKIRAQRRIFLHKGAFHKFKGYAYSQLNKAKNKNPEEGSKRAKNIEEHGFDTKFCYHVVRLLDEVEQILTLHDIDLERSKEYLKAIRRGDISFETIQEYFARREKELEEEYVKSTLPHKPDEALIKTLLFECLEMHYGTLDAATVVIEGREKMLLRQIKALCDQAGL